MNKHAIVEANDIELDRIQMVFSGENEWVVDDAYQRYLNLGGQLEEPEFVDKIRELYLKVHENGNHWR